MSDRNDKAMRDWPVQPVIDWLFSRGCLMKDDTRFVYELGHELNACGAPVDRLRTIMRVLHPEMVGSSQTWTKSTDATHQVNTGRGIRESDRFIGSPMQQLLQTEEPVRQPLDRLQENAHSTYTGLRDEGFTDYLALPVITADGYRAAFIIVTAIEGGFTDRDIDKFQAVRNHMVPILEVQWLRYLSRSLLNTYVGRRTGEKVLAGMIKRGDADTINAALWFSDLRNFTGISETLPPDQVIGMLNDYFEFVAAAVTSRGGEILRFIGDAMLIVFPIDERHDERTACQAAIDSAIDAQDTLGSLNHQRRRHEKPEIAFGVGLNVGEVVYGNVGAPDRLDFTVMGPAVNRTARLESLTKKVQANILFSSRFSRLIHYPTILVGVHEVAGIDGTIEIHSLAPGHTSDTNQGN